MSERGARDLLYADAHLHSNPVSGLGIEFIAKKFRERGGWFIGLVGLPPTSLGLRPDLEGFSRALEIFLRECRRLKETGISHACLGGYHPAMIDKMIEGLRLGPEEVYRISVEIIERVVKLVREGLLDGIAEVGRPHYKTQPEYVVLADIVFERVLEIAREEDIVVHLHLEEGGWVTAYDVSTRLRRHSLNPWRVVLHHARPRNLRPAVSMGLVATVPALPQVIEAVRDIEKRFVFESDYLDDPKRPGKPLYPWDIVEHSKTALERGILSQEDLYRIHIDNITRIYEVRPP